MQNTSIRIAVASFALAAVVAACAGKHEQDRPKTGNQTQPGAKLEVASAAFENGQPIPSKHTCDGQDLSPPLKWSGAPQSTKSFAIICEDPDAPGGTWTHWVLYNLPGDVTELSEGTPRSASSVRGALQGNNDFGRAGYGGPCPPPGAAHHYAFKVFALDSSLDPIANVTKQQLEQAMQSHIVGQGTLVGTYSRK